MAILIANIGTSDIAIKVDNYFLPIGFFREEPNLIKPKEGTPEAMAWQRRNQAVKNFCHQCLNISTEKPSFREISRLLLAETQKSPQIWCPRLSIGRIQGVINSAFNSSNVVQAHLIVTDQTEVEPTGHKDDTVYAFALIDRLFHELEPAMFLGSSPKLSLHQEKITFSAVDEDKLYGYYADLFERLDPDEITYVSIKGGTPQMQQALRAHALVPHTKAQIFIKPTPEVMAILKGKPSSCGRVSYWRYQKNQRHQTVKHLLERWDFDGAAIVLKEWLNALKAVSTDDSDPQYEKTVEEVITALRFTVANMNLDKKTSRDLQNGNEYLNSLSKNFDDLENLLAQCKIYFGLENVSYFLYLLGSFYESTQHRMIEVLGNADHIISGKRGSSVSIEKIREKSGKNQELLELLSILEKHVQNSGNSLGNKLSLGNRFNRQAYISSLCDFIYGKAPGKQPPSVDGWNKLNFWYDARNDLVHGTKGIDKNRMGVVYKNYVDKELNSQRKSKAEGELACPPEKIFPTMRSILEEIGRIDKQLRHFTQGQETEYGLYGCIREWAIASLKS